MLVAVSVTMGCSDPTASERGFRLELNLIGADTIRSRGEARTLVALVSNDAGPHPASNVQFSVDRPDVIRLVRMSPHMVSLQSLVDGTARVTASFGDLTQSIGVVVRRRIAQFRLRACGPSEAVIMHAYEITDLWPVLTDSIGHQMPAPSPIQYSSADTTVVVVNKNGHAMGASVGRTLVTGRLALPESTIVARCQVTVYPPWLWP
jgi:hypothetical protein